MSERKCPECGSTKLSHTMEGLVCSQCGLILESTVMFSGSMII